MPRPISSGVPERPTRYLTPHTRHRLIVASLVGPVVVLLGAFGFYRAGYVGVASPGPVSLRHAPLDARCEECHRSSFPHTVADIRCERCHDPRATGRLQVSAHASWIPPSHRVVGQRSAPPCVQCHTDHLGRSASLLAAADDCASCHGFVGLDGHPEFAVTQANRRPTAGLHFGHQRHLEDVKRTLGRGCEACHRPTADLSGFEPISFDRHCAVCHLKDGVLPGMTDPVAERLVTSVGEGASADTHTTISIRRPGRGRVVASGLIHRDPWILQNLLRLNRGLGAESDDRDRAALQTRLSALEQARKAGPLAARSTSDLAALIAAAPAHAGTLTDGAAGRARLELERRSQGGGANISLAATLLDDRALETGIAAIRSQLASIESRSAPAPLSTDAAVAQSAAAGALLVPCVTCHEVSNGTRLAPVGLAARGLARARFTHAPHVAQVACETCHTTVASSGVATDVITPGIQICQTCHGTRQATIACIGCHRFHPPPEAGLE
jgi:hypothetical protein